jgi:hypothetical protein
LLYDEICSIIYCSRSPKMRIGKDKQKDRRKSNMVFLVFWLPELLRLKQIIKMHLENSSVSKN